MERPIIKCSGCNEQKELHAKGMCYKCYKKQYTQKEIKCKACGRIRPHKAFGLCGGCHIRLHHYENVKRYNAKKSHNLPLEKVLEITKVCASCGFDKLIALHHLNGNRSDTSDANLVGLCPNCHKMIHSYPYFEEIKKNLAKNGRFTEKIHPSNYANKR